MICFLIWTVAFALCVLANSLALDHYPKPNRRALNDCRYIEIRNQPWSRTRNIWDFDTINHSRKYRPVINSLVYGCVINLNSRGLKCSECFCLWRLKRITQHFTRLPHCWYFLLCLGHADLDFEIWMDLTKLMISKELETIFPYNWQKMYSNVINDRLFWIQKCI